MTGNKPNHNIRSATLGERERLVEILVEAFDRDPLGQWLYPNQAKRRREHTSLFTKVLGDATPSMIVDTTDRLDAVAVWRSPTYTPIATPPQVAKRGDKLFAAIAKATPPYPHWYLAFLGARVSGTGAGVALMKHRLSLIDGPVALWTGNEANLNFYAKFGFDVLSRHDVEGATAWWLGRAADVNDHHISHTVKDASEAAPNLMLMSGGCQCGAVRYRFSGAPGAATICHCRMCQKASGNVALPLISLSTGDLTWIRGTPSEFRSSPYVARGFCAHCGTPLYMREDGEPDYEIAIGSLDNPAAVPPKTQMGIESRLAWFGSLHHLPARRTDQDRTPADLARLISKQHPDRDIEPA